MGHLLRTIGFATFAFLSSCGGAIERSDSDTATQIDEPSEDGAVIADVPSASTATGSHSSYELRPHAGVVIRSMRLHVRWIGEESHAAAGSVASDFSRWYVKSEPWRVLAQYGVEAGEVASIAVVSAKEALPGVSDLPATIPLLDLEAAIGPIMRRAREATGTTTSAHTSELQDAFVFVLPPEVNVSLGTRGTYTYKTCVDTLGYHGFDGEFPYVVLPPCTEGRSTFVLSHELAEMASDPIIGKGWLDPKASTKSVGEAADLCKDKGPARVDGWDIARLWSNRDRACLPK